MNVSKIKPKKTRVAKTKAVDSTETETIDGKFREEPTRKRSVSEILGGERAGSDYSTTDAEEYVASLRRMTFTDLQRHSIEIGIRPNYERRTLENVLVKEFRKRVSSYFGRQEVIQATKESNPKSILFYAS